MFVVKTAVIIFFKRNRNDITADREVRATFTSESLSLT